MEETTNQSPDPNELESREQGSEKLNELKQKVNVDEQAIQEAREAVGDDEEKIKEYLINNRGL